MSLPDMDLNVDTIVYQISHLGIAYLLAFAIGLDRERGARSAGLRTFPLVGVASCGFVLLGIDVLGLDVDAQSRILYGLMTGIGFIGGGAILKDRTGVVGTATAASIWNTGAIGAAVGYGRYEIAIALTVLNVVTLQVITPLKRVLSPASFEKE